MSKKNYPRSIYLDVQSACENIYFYSKQIAALRKDLRENPSIESDQYARRDRRFWLEIYIRCRQFWLYQMNKNVGFINDLYQNHPRL